MYRIYKAIILLTNQCVIPVKNYSCFICNLAFFTDCDSIQCFLSLIWFHSNGSFLHVWTTMQLLYCKNMHVGMLRICYKLDNTLTVAIGFNCRELDVGFFKNRLN